MVTLAAAAGVGALLVGLTLAARRRLVRVTVTGTSMEPVLVRGSGTLVWRTRRHRRGDIVLLASDGAEQPLMIKYVVAVAGDRLTPDRAGDAPAVDIAEPVPAGYIYVRGTAPDSLDSRSIGYVPATAVRGVVIAPRRRGGWVPVSPPRPGR